MNPVLCFIYGIKIFRIHGNNLSESTHIRRWEILLGGEWMQLGTEIVNDNYLHLFDAITSFKV